jgi:hypothetical protein
MRNWNCFSAVAIRRFLGRCCLCNIAHVGLFLRGPARWRRSCHSKNRDHAGPCSASALTGFASVRLFIFSDATFAAAISTRRITYGFWITKARCRTRRKIACSSSAIAPRRRGSRLPHCDYKPRSVPMRPSSNG